MKWSARPIYPTGGAVRSATAAAIERRGPPAGGGLGRRPVQWSDSDRIADWITSRQPCIRAPRQQQHRPLFFPSFFKQIANKRERPLRSLSAVAVATTSFSFASSPVHRIQPPLRPLQVRVRMRTDD